MSFELLLEACRIDPADSELPPETLSDLTSAYELAKLGRAGRYGGDLPHAVTLLAAALGRLPRFNPTHLPFGYSGPHVKSREWIDLDRIELLMTQVIGLCQAAWDVRKVDFESKNAISDAASLGLIQEKEYDAWVPGMASGSGWRTAISATPYGLVRARQAAATPPVASSQQKAPPAQAGTQASGVEAPVPAEPLLVETGSNITPLTTPPPFLKAVTTPQADDEERNSPPPSEDRYGWARQAELVRATNQVLGQEEGLNSGVLCRACKDGEIATNKKMGRASMVDVQSFLVWLGKTRELPKDELDQVRNAIIGEISSRPAKQRSLQCDSCE